MRKSELLLLVVSFLVLSACSGNSPKSVAKKFNKAIYTADFQTAKSLCTDNTKQAVDYVAAFASQKTEKMKKADIRYEITETKISDDEKSADVKAIITGSINLSNGEIKDTVISKTHLVKVDDKWLVDYKLK